MRRLKTYKPLKMTKKVIWGTCLTWFLASGPAAAQKFAVEGQAGADVKTVYMYNVSIPTTMLIGPDGIIVMGNADHDTLQKKLAELMP